MLACCGCGEACAGRISRDTSRDASTRSSSSASVAISPSSSRARRAVAVEVLGLELVRVALLVLGVLEQPLDLLVGQGALGDEPLQPCAGDGES